MKKRKEGSEKGKKINVRDNGDKTGLRQTNIREIER